MILLFASGYLVHFENRLPKNRFATIICPFFWGYSSVGRASHSQRERSNYAYLISRDLSCSHEGKLAELA